MSVTTSIGETDSEIIPTCIGQGSFGATPASSLNIGCAVKELFDNENWVLSLNSLILQFDILKMKDTMEQARGGAEKIDDMLRKKQLSVNYDKSKYMVIGQKSFKEKVKKDTETNPTVRST